MLIARLLGPEPGATVADVCAAPGTKTTHLAELMDNRGRILAFDREPTRLARVAEAAARLGISIIDARDGSGRESGPRISRPRATASSSTRRARTWACCAAIPR